MSNETPLKEGNVTENCDRISLRLDPLGPMRDTAVARPARMAAVYPLGLTSDSALLGWNFRIACRESEFILRFRSLVDVAEREYNIKDIQSS